MRTLILLRGSAGCGKSTWITQNKLEEYTINSDKIRLLYQSPKLKIDNTLTISQKIDGKVWDTIFQLLEERMQHGEFTIIDATHSRTSLISRYKNLVKQYKYRCYVVDFGDVPLDIILERNKSREGYKLVPEAAIRNMYARIKTQPSQSFVTVIKPNQFWNIFKGLKEPLDCSNYDKVVCFGDIHGCYSPLKEYFDANPVNEKNLYIFIGDYIDRGLENIDTLKLLISHMNDKNFILLEGNHEIQLNNYVHNRPITSNNFLKTREELVKSDINNDDLSQFYRKLCQLLYFKYGSTNFLVTHGGLPSLPTSFVSTDDLIHGVGEYEDIEEVFESWNKNTKYDIQICGHRNIHDFKINEYIDRRCLNLCEHIEYGGNLRIVEIKKIENIGCAFEYKLIKNNKFNKQEHRDYEGKWIEVKEVNNIVALQHNPYVLEKDMGEGISSFNFTSMAFRKGIWNAQTTKARGLFVDVKNNKVVARSYDKFFNLGQNEDSELYAIKTNWKFPLVGYVKYNGFLGILSWNKAKNDWYVCSKSLMSGEFVEYIKDTISKCWNEETIGKVKKFLMENDYSLVFEVINPEKDTHIIEYTKPMMKLLDCIKNDFKFERYDYKSLCELSQKLGIEYKIDFMYFKNFEGFKTFLDEIESGKINPTEIEGLVVEDAENRMVKIKFPFYSLWKYMREVLVRMKKGGVVDLAKLSDAEENYIYAHMKTLDLTKFDNIIQVRKSYEAVPKNR